MKILLLGGTGRLGKKISNKLFEHNAVFEAIPRESTESFEKFQTYLNKELNTELNLLLLDVSLASVTENICDFLEQINPKKNLRFMIGTTGHTKVGLNKINQLSKHLPVCLIPNFSKGIFLFNEMLRASYGHNTLKNFTNTLGFKTELTDKHHIHKKDSPSGTAKLLNTALELDDKDIHSVREGEIVGEHIVSFTTPYETLEIKHTVQDRDVFAEGAYDAACKFMQKPYKPGLYSQKDVFE